MLFKVDVVITATATTHFAYYWSTLHLALKFSNPDWIRTLNEDSSENNREKTFGLEKMMLGFDQAYNGDGEAYFFNNLTISLIK